MRAVLLVSNSERVMRRRPARIGIVDGTMESCYVKGPFLRMAGTALVAVLAVSACGAAGHPWAEAEAFGKAASPTTAA